MQLKELKSIVGSLAFWVVVFNAFVFYLQLKGWIGQAELGFVTAVAAPFVVINQARKAAKDIGGVSPSVTEIEDNPVGK